MENGFLDSLSNFESLVSCLWNSLELVLGIPEQCQANRSMEPKNW